jgi:hypothetical protein
MIAKTGIDLSSRRPELTRLDAIIDAAFAEFWKPAVCTATNLDGYTASGKKIHKEHSLHYEDLAEDIRSQSVGGAKAQAVLHARLKALIDEAYPRLYDVLMERPATLTCAHCGRREHGTPEDMRALADELNRAGHKAEVSDGSHIHVEASPTLMAQIKAERTVVA